jgi:hypothetical protein
MQKTLLALTLGSALVMGAAQWPANAADVMAEPNVTLAQESAKAAMRSSVAAALGVDVTQIEIVMAPHLVNVTIVSSGYAVGSGADREADAVKAGAAVQRSMDNRVEFSGVGAIHIGFEQRPANHGKPLPSFDFYKGPAGEFVLHKT